MSGGVRPDRTADGRVSASTASARVTFHRERLAFAAAAAEHAEATGGLADPGRARVSRAYLRLIRAELRFAEAQVAATRARHVARIAAGPVERAATPAPARRRLSVLGRLLRGFRL